MNIIERLEAIAIKAQEWDGLALHEQLVATQAAAAIRCLSQIRAEIGSVVEAIKNGPSEGAILAAEQAYHDAPDAGAQVDGVADAIRAAWAVDLEQEQHIDL